jgi:hypothetical protein
MVVIGGPVRGHFDFAEQSPQGFLSEVAPVEIAVEEVVECPEAILVDCACRSAGEAFPASFFEHGVAFGGIGIKLLNSLFEGMSFSGLCGFYFSFALANVLFLGRLLFQLDLCEASEHGWSIVDRRS